MPNTKTIVIAVGKEIFYPIPHRNIIFLLLTNHETQP